MVPKGLHQRLSLIEMPQSKPFFLIARFGMDFAINWSNMTGLARLPQFIPG